MKESDWKIFKKIKEKAIDNYCAKAFVEFSEIIQNNKEHIYDRYLMHYSHVYKNRKELDSIFDGHSRSKATMQLLLIRDAGLADDEMLEELSPEFSKATDPERI